MQPERLPCFFQYSRSIVGRIAIGLALIASAIVGYLIGRS